MIRIYLFTTLLQKIKKVGSLMIVVKILMFILILIILKTLNLSRNNSCILTPTLLPYYLITLLVE